MLKKTVKYLWILFGGCFLMFLFVMLCAGNGWLGFQPLPSFEELENPKSNLASEIISADGKTLGRYFKENRVNIRYSDLSPHLITALVATEDERFYNHSGIDFRGLVRAVVKLGKAGGASTITQQLAKMLFNEPASNMAERIMQKLQEWIIAVRLERYYTKEEIIAMYFNRLDFVNNAVGVKSAANVYFSKEPNELLLEEAAMLVGMAKNPSLFNPVKRPDTTTFRRNVVLAQMVKNNTLSKNEFDSLKAVPLKLNYKVVDHKEGIAPYFREVLRIELDALFKEKDENGHYKLAKKDGTPYDIYKDGLKIYTTIHSRMQEYAEWAVQEHLKTHLQPALFNDLKRKKNAPFDSRVSQREIKQILDIAIKRSQRYRIFIGNECPKCNRRGKSIEKMKEGKSYFYHCTSSDCNTQWQALPSDSLDAYFGKKAKMTVFTWSGDKDTLLAPIDSIRYYKSFLQAGLMSMEPQTGYIRAWVGGINFKHFAFDHVYQAKRQVGSTFKPIVYSVAMRDGFSPCYELPNVQYTFRKGEFGLLQDWTPKNSEPDYGYNVTLKYALANSLNTVTAWIMKRFGPQTVVDMARDLGITSHLEPVPSLCLGVADLNVYELTGANSTFANKGVWIQPTYLMRIEDKHGNVIKEFIPKSKEALDEQSAYVMVQLMKGVVDGAYNKAKGKTTGTGMRLRGSITKDRPYVGFRNPIAAKTGTTQNNSDAWFMGLTPELVTGVWVGAEDRSVRFSSTYYGQGANMGLPIWGYYMQKVFADTKLKYSQGDFEKPETPLKIELDCSIYQQQNTGEEDFNK